MATTNVKVEDSTSVVTTSSTTLELPKDTAQLRSVSDNELTLGLSATLTIQGPDSNRVAQSTHNLFQEMLTTLELSASSSNSSAQFRDEEEYTRAFHTHLTAVLSNQTKVQLMRSPSSDQLLQDLSSADGLLSRGIDFYLAAVRRVLRSSGLVDPQVVEVALFHYCYSVPKPNSNDESSLSTSTVDHGGETVGTSFFKLFFGVCMETKRRLFPVKRPVRSVHEMETPLLHTHHLGNSGMNEGLHVLSDLTCLIKPGRLTLVLGPPGSGKTSLLRAMSGKLLTKPTSGELTYNGRAVSELKHLANWVAYASQSDEHMPLLTVRETLTHAFKCRKEIRFEHPQQGDASISDTQKELLSAYRQLDVDVFLAVLGLTRCADTIIGNETLKGVSGGERRRVTLGEMLAVGSQVLCLDEISTGLDSAATFDICQYLRQVAHFMDTCVVVALLQPAPEVLNLFDDVLVLAEGRIIFHGERSLMLPYFESLGFTCPEKKDLGDFIQELPTLAGSKQFAKSPEELAELGISQVPPRTAKEFAKRWKESDLFKREDAQVMQSLSEMQKTPKMELRREEGLDIDLLPENAWYVRLRLAIAWSWSLKMKDMVKIQAKFAQNIIMGLLFGTLFYQIPKDEAYQKNILLLQVLMFSSQSAIPEVQANARARIVYHKHIDQHFYSGWMLALAQTLTSLPLVLLDTLIFGQLIYWLTGLTSQWTHFVLFCVVNTLFGATMQAMMGAFPYVFRDELKATIGAVLVLIGSILLSGVVATEDVIPVYLRFLFWANPLAHAFRTLANIEFLSSEYDQTPCEVSLNGHTIKIPQRCGEFFLASRQISSGWEYVYSGIIVLVGYLLVCSIFTALTLSFIRFDPLPATSSANPKEEEEEVANPSSAAAASGATLPKEQIVLAVHELGYTIVKNKKDTDLLKNISCWALPGRMLALMGSSGAGKTTLLDVLAGVKTQGRIRGQVYLNGRVSTKREFTKLCGYVQQFGIHNLKSTILESLEFSMRLRLGRDEQASPEFLLGILRLLELEPIQHMTCEKCTMEQNKRLTLGVELVANPSIVFADEPTSSLDARAAGIVIRVLKRVAASGRTVIATIHQPSIEIFSQFDDLLLLKSGGEVAYFGEIGAQARSMIAYFDPLTDQKFDKFQNPSAWMIQVIGGGTDVARKQQQSRNSAHQQVDFAQIYRNSDLKRNNDAKLAQFCGRTTTTSSDSPSTLSSSSRCRQMSLLLYRDFTTLWRMPDYTFMRFMVMAIFGALFVSIFFQQPVHNMADIQSRILCITFSMSLASMFTMMTLIPYVMNRRALFYRERASGMYRSTVFALSAMISELPYLFINSSIMVNIVYWGVGFSTRGWFPFAYFYLASVVYLIMMAFMGFTMSQLMPEPLSAQLGASAFFSIMNIFAGISVPVQHMPRAYHWLHYFSPLRWYFEGILSTQFHGDDSIICNPLGLPVTEGFMKSMHLCTSTGKSDLKKITGVQVTMEEYVLNDFLKGFKYDHRWIDVGILGLWIGCLGLIIVIAANVLSYDNR